MGQLFVFKTKRYGPDRGYNFTKARYVVKKNGIRDFGIYKVKRVVG